MDIYVFYVAFLAGVAGLIAYYQRKGRAAREAAQYTTSTRPEETDENDEGSDRLPEPRDGGAVSRSSHTQAITFRNNYFAVYALVLAADWLQGPYIYSIYHEDHKLSEHTIAALFGAGFVSGGISSSFLGLLADKYGRRNACRGFCVVTTLSCLSVLAKNNLPLLFLGRMLGGLSSTLLYSVFEAWMVTEHNARDLAATLPLSDMFSWSSTLSGIIAITAGVVGESLVSYTGSRASPFLLAILLLGLAAVAITKYWNENFGSRAPPDTAADAEEKPGMPPPDSPSHVTTDRHRLLALGLATTIFEGSMYLFVFFWTPTLTAAAATNTTTSTTAALPLGLIFSSFMCAMMIGSMISSHLSRRPDPAPARVLVDVLAAAAAALLIPVLTRGETATFGAFVLFEMAVGVYFPTMGTLKSELVGDDVRAKVYTWMRLPLNLFVFGALGVTEEGSEHRSRVFNVLGGLLLVTALVVKRVLA